MSGLSRIAVCCLPALATMHAFAAAPVAAPPGLSPASSRAARAPIPSVMRCDAPPTVQLPNNKGVLSQKDMEELKAGRPALLMIGLDDAEIQAATATDRKVRNLRKNDAAIRQMEAAGSESLKAAVLADYRSEDIVEAQKTPGWPMLTARIHDVRTLQALMDDPRVRAISSNLPMCPD